jgi:hypothetical protein
MKTTALLLLSIIACAEELTIKQNPYLMKHDTATHIALGIPLGTAAGLIVRDAGAPKWVQCLTAFAIPCIVGQAKERCIDKNYSGKDANSWVIAGAGAALVTVAIDWKF